MPLRRYHGIARNSSLERAAWHRLAPVAVGPLWEGAAQSRARMPRRTYVRRAVIAAGPAAGRRLCVRAEGGHSIAYWSGTVANGQRDEAFRGQARERYGLVGAPYDVARDEVRRYRPLSAFVAAALLVAQSARPGSPFRLVQLQTELPHHPIWRCVQRHLRPAPGRLRAALAYGRPAPAVRVRAAG